jgi:hypothetical protein
MSDEERCFLGEYTKKFILHPSSLQALYLFEMFERLFATVAVVKRLAGC